jgi:quercetin dioxygenase-like cupin family protein
MMKVTVQTTATITIAAVGLGMIGVASTALAQPEPIAVQPLTERHAFTDNVAAEITLTPEGREQHVVEIDDASNIGVFEITVQPGAMFPWHTHPGLAVGTITQGEFVYIYADDCIERTYPTGTAFVDPGFDNVHMAFNPSEEQEVVVVAVYIGAPDEGPLTLPVDESEGAELDERCGIDRPASS